MFTTPRIETLRKKGNDAKGIFRKLATDLMETNKEIEVEEAKEMSKIEEAQIKLDNYAEMKTENNTFANQLNKLFLND